MRLEELADRIPLEWRADFVHFVQTGEAGEAFLRFLDENRACQDAVEEAFEVQAAAFERFAGPLREPKAAGADPGVILSNGHKRRAPTAHGERPRLFTEAFMARG